jgi:hypothetical protein
LAATPFDVHAFAIRRRDARRPFEVRWRAAGHDKSKSFITRALADSYRAELVRAAAKTPVGQADTEGVVTVPPPPGIKPGAVGPETPLRGQSRPMRASLHWAEHAAAITSLLGSSHSRTIDLYSERK